MFDGFKSQEDALLKIRGWTAQSERDGVNRGSLALASEAIEREHQAAAHNAFPLHRRRLQCPGASVL